MISDPNEIAEHFNLAINEWGWVGYEELSESRKVLSTEDVGRGG